MPRFSQRSESSEPHVRLPRLGAWHQERSPRPFGFENQQGVITGLAETETPLLEGAHKVLYAPGTRGTKQWLHRNLGQTYLLVL